MGKLGPQLIAYARGEEDSPVRYIWEEQEVKSVGNSITFPRNLTTREEVNAGITALADEVAGRLRKHGLQCATVQIQIKDPQFRVISRQKALERPTDLEREIRKAALELVWNNWTRARHSDAGGYRSCPHQRRRRGDAADLLYR